MLEAALMLVAVQELEMPAGLMPAMTAASRALFDVEHCAGKSPSAEEEFAQRGGRYFNLGTAVSAIWGRRPEEDVAEATSPRLRCTEKAGATDRGRFDVAIADAEQIFQQAITPMREGVWLGALRLCRGTIVRAEPATNFINDPVLRVWLSEDMRARFADLTEAIMETRQGAGQIALRVNGRLVAELGVYERMEGGTVDLPMPSLRSPEPPSLLGAVTDPC
jgi:hypothetical protein